MTPRWRALVQALALFVVCVLVVRIGPRWARPADSGIDCNQRSVQRAILEQCAALHPDDVELLSDLAADYARASSWDRAAATYRKALVIDPFEGDLHLRLGDVLLAQGDVMAAREEAARAAALQPGRAAARELMRRATPADAVKDDIQ